jgi:colanic acid biosynthesis glycosyl transferase WcaI
VARLLQDDPRIQFVFGGNGSGRGDLQARCAGLTNVRFLDLQPLERLNDWLGLADVHLLPQRADAADLVMPSKLTGMLASGRAVLATALPETELGRVVAQDAACGLVVPPEDPAAMTDAVLALAANASWREQLGIAGRNHAVHQIDRESVLQRFEKYLTDIPGNAVQQA